MSFQLIKASWPVPANIHAITTTRSGGVSKAPYDSFNLAHHVGDQENAVTRNRELLQQIAGLPSTPCWLNQTHGIKVVQANESNHGVDADGSYTDTAGVVCAVMTADCLPVVLYNPNKQIVAAVHAGWRGLVGGIVEQGVERTGADGCLAWLGPAIGPESFEVGDDVLTAFINKDQQHRQAFSEAGEGKWHADIYMLARQVLKAAGVTAVFGGEYCTVNDESLFYSYRRDKQTGRMATLAWMSGR